MSHRLGVTFGHRADIARRVKTGENSVGEPIYDTETVSSGVRCRFEDRSTEFVRDDFGETVSTPARVVFPPGTDVSEGDEITVDGIGEFEARQIERARDHFRGGIDAIQVTVEGV